MTGRNTPSPDSVLHLLKEAGVDEDPALLEAVGHIAGLAERPAPEPSAELAQLMASGGKTAGGRLTKGRITFIGGALAVSMGVGMSGVAAGPAERHVELDGSIDSVTRFWARDHADRVDAGSAAGPRAGALPSPDAAAPPSSDVAGLHSSDEPAQVPRTPDGGVPSSDGALAAGGSEFAADLPPALPAAHPGSAPAPTPITGVTVPSPSGQSAHGGIASAPGTPDSHVPAPNTVDAHRWDLQTSGPQGSASIFGPQHRAGEPGGTAAPGIAEVPEPADGSPRYGEEPVRFATLAWVDRGPDEPTSDAAPLMLLRAPDTAPDNVIFFSASMSGDGQWLALFVPDVTEPTRDPVTEEYVPGKPESWSDSPDAVDSSDSPDGTGSPDGTSPLPHAVPDVRGEGPVDEVPELESPAGVPDGESGTGVPSSEELPQESGGIAPEHSGSDATSAEKEPVGTAPSQKPSEDVSRVDEPAGSTLTESTPVGSNPNELMPTEPTPTLSSPVPLEPSGAAPATVTPDPPYDEPSWSPSETLVGEPIGVLPESAPEAVSAE